MALNVDFSTFQFYGVFSQMEMFSWGLFGNLLEADVSFVFLLPDIERSYVDDVIPIMMIDHTNIHLTAVVKA